MSTKIFEFTVQVSRLQIFLADQKDEGFGRDFRSLDIIAGLIVREH